MIHGQTCNLSLILCSHSSHNLFRPDTDELLGSITGTHSAAHTTVGRHTCLYPRTCTYMHTRALIMLIHGPYPHTKTALPGLKSSLQPQPVLASLSQRHSLSVFLLTTTFRCYRACYCWEIMAHSVMLAGSVKTWSCRIINDIGFLIL